MEKRAEFPTKNKTSDKLFARIIIIAKETIHHHPHQHPKKDTNEKQ
jgi:hypothetical protein